MIDCRNENATLREYLNGGIDKGAIYDRVPAIVYFTNGKEVKAKRNELFKFLTEEELNSKCISWGFDFKTKTPLLKVEIK